MRCKRGERDKYMNKEGERGEGKAMTTREVTVRDVARDTFEARSGRTTLLTNSPPPPPPLSLLSIVCDFESRDGENELTKVILGE